GTNHCIPSRSLIALFSAFILSKSLKFSTGQTSTYGHLNRGNPYGQNNNNGAKNLDIDNVGVQGEAIPTPALLPAAMLGLGSALRRKRKQDVAAV
ncbi:PTPA-CTERM sorting domain-containing protein, partial [Alkalinema pantanalense CENA528]|uniref:PTPA-CTERM sorting domain-containing protein n=1 Tax=Alkalinema pantanalense TaxID=1620705 RepID=UPI003D6EFBFB